MIDFIWGTAIKQERMEAETPVRMLPQWSSQDMMKAIKLYIYWKWTVWEIKPKISLWQERGYLVFRFGKIYFGLFGLFIFDFVLGYIPEDYNGRIVYFQMSKNPKVQQLNFICIMLKKYLLLHLISRFL